jgi:hypothetical protein
MPGDPRECRKHAARCAELAAEAKTEALKTHFLTLSKTWESLARELEVTQSMVAALNSELGKPE